MYWMLEAMAPDDKSIALMGEQPDLSSIAETFSWYGGSRFEFQIPTPLGFKLDPYGGNFIPYFFSPPIPLIHDQLLGVLKKSNVDNIDIYDAIVSDDDGQNSRTDFKAVNIVGLIQCADLDQSECEIDDPDIPGGVEFDSLVIDESRTGGALLFRLYEAPNGLVIHDSVKQVVEQSDFPGIAFVDPVDWVG